MGVPLDYIIINRESHRVMILVLKLIKNLLEMLMVVLLCQILCLLEDIKQDRDIVTTVEQEAEMVEAEVVVPEVAQEPVIMVVGVEHQGISLVKLNFYPVLFYLKEQDKVVI